LTNIHSSIHGLSSEKIPEFISHFARMCSCIIYALAIGWKLALVFLSISPLIVYSFNVTIKVTEDESPSPSSSLQIIVKYTIKEVQAFASASAIAQEVLQNIRTVTAFHGQEKEEER
jgi:ABC-type multidrug transport system fused ATPase/permease subunit